MKKCIVSLLLIIIVTFLLIMFMTNNNQKNNNHLKTIITAKTDIKNIVYTNNYNGYYIAKNDKYIYVFNNKYDEVLKIDNILVYENQKNYAIIYKDNKVMYLNDYLKDNKLYYEYYDLYTYKLINKIVIGG